MNEVVNHTDLCNTTPLGFVICYLDCEPIQRGVTNSTMREPLCIFRNESPYHDVRDHNRLRSAIRHRDKRLIRQLIDDGVEVNGFYEGGYPGFDSTPEFLEKGPKNYALFPPLHLAVMSRDPDIVKVLLDKGADANVQVWGFDTPLTMAAKMQNPTVIDLLLSHDSIQDLSDFDDLSHLHIACMRNNTAVVRRLLLMNQGRKINIAVRDTSVHWAGYTPLHFAVYFECVETVQYLLDCGADITIANAKQCTPLHLANLHRNEIIIDLLLEAHKYEVKNPTDSEGLSHFHIACTRDNISIIKHFLNLGVDINNKVKYTQWYGWSPIHFAMLYECYNVIDLLLETKVSLESHCFPELLKSVCIAKNKSVHDLFLGGENKSYLSDEEEHFSTFLNACIKNEAQKVQELVDSDMISIPADLNKPIWNGWTPLHLAIKCKSESVVKILLNRGADILAQDVKGRAALHFSFSHSSHDIHLEIVKHFNASTPNLMNLEGLSFFHILCALGDVDAIQNFLHNGVDANIQVKSESASWAGFTPLHFAVKSYKLDVVQILLKFGVNILLTNDLNLNPFDLGIDLDGRTDHYAHEDDLFDILAEILSYASSKHINLNTQGITVLHGLCLSKNTRLEQFQEYLTSHQNEIEKAIQSPRWFQDTPLNFTAYYLRLDLAKSLLINGANPLNVNGGRSTFIENAFPRRGIPSGVSIEDVEDLFTLATQCEKDSLKTSHFHIACGLGLTRFVKHILDVTFDTELRTKYLNSTDYFGHTPLHSLMLIQNDANARKDTANLLLEYGADVHVRDLELQTPLHCAQRRRDTADGVTRILLKYGADVNAQNIYGQTPLQKLLSDIPERGFTTDYTLPSFCNQVTLLLHEGSDVNVADRRGQTCLKIVPHLISRSLRRCIACILLRHVKKLQIIGYHINEDNEQFCSEMFKFLVAADFNEANFEEECERELAIMKNEYIDRYTNLYSILFKSLNKMTLHCENAYLQNMINSDAFLGKFPKYGYLIKLQVKNGKIRQPLLIDSKNSLGSILAGSLPSQCTEIILSYLSNADLRNIIASV